jgi:hypothetical protein
MRKTREKVTELERKIEDLERLIHAIIALGRKNLVEKAEGECLFMKNVHNSKLELLLRL